MRKIRVLAVREYWATVWTKGFLLSILGMPLSILGITAVQGLAYDLSSFTRAEQHCAIVDRTPAAKLYAAAGKAAERRNARIPAGEPIYLLMRVEPSAADAG